MIERSLSVDRRQVTQLDAFRIPALAIHCFERSVPVLFVHRVFGIQALVSTSSGRRLFGWSDSSSDTSASGVSSAVSSRQHDAMRDSHVETGNHIELWDE